MSSASACRADLSFHAAAEALCLVVKGRLRTVYYTLNYRLSQTRLCSPNTLFKQGQQIKRRKRRTNRAPGELRHLGRPRHRYIPWRSHYVSLPLRIAPRIGISIPSTEDKTPLFGPWCDWQRRQVHSTKTEPWIRTFACSKVVRCKRGWCC